MKLTYPQTCPLCRGSGQVLKVNGEVVRAIRRHRQLSLEHAAQLIGIGSSYLWQIEADVRTPSQPIIRKLIAWMNHL